MKLACEHGEFHSKYLLKKRFFGSRNRRYSVRSMKACVTNFSFFRLMLEIEQLSISSILGGEYVRPPLSDLMRNTHTHTHTHTRMLTYLLTYLLHGAESLRS